TGQSARVRAGDEPTSDFRLSDSPSSDSPTRAGRDIVHAVTEPAALTDSRLANLGARLIADAYERFESRFRIVTRRARIRFAERDWVGMASDARERLALYAGAASATAVTIRETLGERTEDQMVWASMKAVYSGLITRPHHRDRAGTFLGPVPRRRCPPRGVHPRHQPAGRRFGSPPSEAMAPLYRSDPAMGAVDLVAAILEDAGLAAPFADLHRDA